MLFFNRGKTFGILGTVLALAWLNRKRLRDLMPALLNAKDERKELPDVPTAREIEPEIQQFGAPAVDPGLEMQQDFKNVV